MYIVVFRFSSVVSGKECPKSSVQLVSDNVRVRLITRLVALASLAPLIETKPICRTYRAAKLMGHWTFKIAKNGNQDFCR